MGRVLTVFAGLLVLALLSVMVLPYVIDWGSYRATIEERLSQALRQPVKIGGTIDITVLPVPVVRLGDVTVGKTGAQARIARLDVELATGPLLRGQWQASEIRLDNPRLWLSLDRRGRLISEAPGGNWPELTIDSLIISEGEITIEQEQRGTRFFVDNITLSASASSLVGPWRAEGTARFEGSATQISIQTGRGDIDGIRAKISVVPSERPIAFDLDALFRRADGRPSFSGALKLAGVGATDATVRQSGWRIEANVDAGTETFIAKDIHVVPAGDDRVIALNGVINLTLGEDMRADAALSARQIDVDRLVGASAQSPASVATIFERLAALPSALTLPPALRLRGSFDAGSLAVAGGLIQDVHASLDLRGGKWQLSELRGRLPGQTMVKLSAAVEPGGKGAAVTGAIDVMAAAPSLLAAWSAGEFFRAQGERSAGASGALELRARYGLSPQRLELTQMRFGVPGAAIAGSADIRWDDGTPKVTFDGMAEDVDVGPVASFFAAFGERLGAVAAADAAIRFKAKRVRHGALEIAGIDVEARREAMNFSFDRVKIGALNGLAVEGSGRISLTSDSRLNLTLSGERLQPAMDALASLLPRLPLLEAVRARAEFLAPLAVKMVFENVDGQLSAHIEGDVGGSKMHSSAQFALNAAGAAALQTAEGEIVNDKAPRLLRQLGLWSGTTLTQMPGRLAFELKGEQEGIGVLTASADLAGSKAAFAGRVALGDLTTMGPGLAFAVSASDINPLLLSLGLVPSHIDDEISAVFKGRLLLDQSSVRLADVEGAVSDVPVSGDIAVRLGALPVVSGRLRAKSLPAGELLALASGANGAEPGDPWSTQTALRSPVTGLAGQLTIDGQESHGWPITVRHPQFVLKFLEDGIGVDDIAGEVAGGKLTGNVVLRKDGAKLRIAGRLALESGRLDEMVWKTGERPVAGGGLDLILTFEGSGRTPAQLIGALEGGGRLVVSQGHFAHLSTAAFAPVIASAAAATAPDLLRLVPLVQVGLDSGDLMFRLLETPLALHEGVLRATNVSLVGADSAIKVSAAADLSRLSLLADIEMEGKPADAGTPGPRLAVHFAGPFDAPRRRLDVRALGDYLNLRRFEGELGKLETLQRQIDEREARVRDIEEKEKERRQKARETPAAPPQPGAAPDAAVSPPAPGPGALPPAPRSRRPAAKPTPAVVNPRLRDLVEGSLRGLPPAPGGPPAGVKLAPLPPPVVIPTAP